MTGRKETVIRVVDEESGAGRGHRAAAKPAADARIYFSFLLPSFGRVTVAAFLPAIVRSAATT